MKLNRTLAVANQKGGVAKTTTVVNLGTAFASCGYSTLVVDLDPQANATSGLGIDSNGVIDSVYEVLHQQKDLRDVIKPTRVPGLNLVPSKNALASAQLDLGVDEASIERLKPALATVKDQYDFILIDCQPSLSVLPLNALVAADGLLVPIQTEYYALEGLSHMYRFLQDMRRSKNPDIDLYGILLTMTDHTRLSQQVSADVRDAFKSRVFNTEIPRNIKLAEAPSHGLPILLYDRVATGSRAYLALAAEILAKEGLAPKLSKKGS